ncbi:MULTISPECIES: 5'/3'-nucleotidase SurE [unclassified Gordonia (in: high G+C Gram-positive bacteria)]|uniref:5'/3'-nucleotidase SurE n=1 Tax=unclassified Gordonia (in: high G+C Gram-positive bacteria) TaxID=2657482 RepID=UPI0009AD5B1B|nr:MULTISPECIES: 5'/3'-nucleotidase SurE [unclassified Gordonia (in: high G+C Gram-positive bacteria)]MDF3281138.1 5'/3'-nucleotidase SurE [Gordonia sp. N1V]OPX06121.1 hypothetical protein B1964_28915 [Gordonia sp. i37]
MTKTKTILVTNDDGVASPGVIALAEVAEAAGHDVWVVAPDRQSSGSAAGLWRDPGASPVVTSRQNSTLRNEVRSAATHPGMIALLAMTGQLGPIPDVVLSGINDASNLGSGVLHSGTAGAAIVGAGHGAVGAAFSLYCDDIADSAPRQWDTARTLIADVLDHIVTAPPGTIFNLNVPNVETLDKPIVQAQWRAEGCVPSLVPFIASFHDANGTTMLPPSIERRVGSDIVLVEAGYPTVSSIRITGDSPVEWAGATPHLRPTTDLTTTKEQ